jgi:hypothetical protein
MNPYEIISGLQYNDKKPRVHPNGFIQVDINEAERLHCWHPELPYRQKTYHPIHDHIFSFESRVLAGRLINVRYATEPYCGWGNKFERYMVQVTEGQETVLVKCPLLEYRVYENQVDVLQKGQGYLTTAFHFHETLSNIPTLTHMKKLGTGFVSGPNSNGASVLVPEGVIPDNDFTRAAVDTDLLWDLIHDAASQ